MCVCVCVCGSIMSDSLQPIHCSPPGYSVHGILQARILEWVVIPFSKGFSQPRDWTWVSHIAGRFFTIWATREDPKKIVQLATKYISTFGYVLSLQVLPSMPRDTDLKHIFWDIMFRDEVLGIQNKNDNCSQPLFMGQRTDWWDFTLYASIIKAQ